MHGYGQTEVHITLERPGNPFFTHLTGQDSEIYRFELDCRRRVRLGTRESQQLLAYSGGAFHIAVQGTERFPLARRIWRPLSPFGVEEYRCERRSELMRSICDEAFLRLHRVAQSFQQLVDPCGQYARLAWQSSLRYGRKVVLATRLDLRGQVGQRFEPVVDTDPHQQQRDAQQRDLRCGHADQNLARESGALLQGLRYRDEHPIVWMARCDQCRNDAHAVAMQSREAEPQTADVGGREIRQGGIPADQALVCRGHFEVGLVDLVELKDLQGYVRQVEFDIAVLGAHRIYEGAGRVDEPPVVHEVGEVEGRKIGGQAIEPQRQHQHDAEPQQQAGAQADRALRCFCCDHGAEVITGPPVC